MADSVNAVVALVGAETLLGREIRDALSQSPLDATVKLITEADEQAGSLTAVADEPSILTKFNPASLESASSVVIAAHPRPQTRY